MKTRSFIDTLAYYMLAGVASVPVKRIKVANTVVRDDKPFALVTFNGTWNRKKNHIKFVLNILKYLMKSSTTCDEYFGKP